MFVYFVWIFLVEADALIKQPSIYRVYDLVR